MSLLTLMPLNLGTVLGVVVGAVGWRLPGEAEVDPRIVVSAGRVEDQGIVDALDVAVHECCHGRGWRGLWSEGLVLQPLLPLTAARAPRFIPIAGLTPLVEKPASLRGSDELHHSALVLTCNGYDLDARFLRVQMLLLVVLLVSIRDSIAMSVLVSLSSWFPLHFSIAIVLMARSTNVLLHKDFLLGFHGLYLGWW